MLEKRLPDFVQAVQQYILDCTSPPTKLEELIPNITDFLDFMFFCTSTWRRDYLSTEI